MKSFFVLRNYGWAIQFTILGLFAIFLVYTKWAYNFGLVAFITSLWFESLHYSCMFGVLQLTFFFYAIASNMCPWFALGFHFWSKLNSRWAVCTLFLSRTKGNTLLMCPVQAEACVFSCEYCQVGVKQLLAMGAVPRSCVPPASPPHFFHPAKLWSAHPHSDRRQA